MLLGLVRIPMYEYYWGLTAAQIELLAMDCPVVVYKNKKDKPKHTKKEMDALMAKWEAKQKEREEKGTKLNLNDFLRTGMDALKNTKTE